MKNKIILSLALLCNLNSEEKLSLDEYLIQYNVPLIEINSHTDIPSGITQQNQYFINLLDKYTNIKKIAEIGFNLGHSTAVFLKARSDIVVVSFDSMFNWWNWIGKNYFSENYPNRHRLVDGHPLITVPQFVAQKRNLKFDCIFINGMHDYHNAIGNLFNMQKLATPNTILIMNNIQLAEVNAVWEKCKTKGLIEELEKLFPLNSSYGWAVGRYKHCTK